MPDAVVIGAGPNGLVAANHLASAGWSVHVLEAQPEPGGAVRSAELTEPGFVHDVFSAFYPLAAASPAFTRLGLEAWGLRWRHSPLVLAHPSAADGTCVVLSRDLDETAASLDTFAHGDGDAWRRLYARFEQLRPHLLRGMTTPTPPVLATIGIAATLRRDLIRFARMTTLGVRRFAEEEFEGDGAARLLAGNALHADLSPELPPGAFFGWFLCGLGQHGGYPFPEGGAQRLTDALVARLRAHGGELTCGARVTRVVTRRGRAVGVVTQDGAFVSATRAVLADTMPQALYTELLDTAVPSRVLRDLDRFQWDSSTFKVDWALNGPIPWRDEACRRSAVVHVADSVDELTQSTAELAQGLIPRTPFLVFGQYALGGAGDVTRCPDGAEVAWAYTHVPQRIRGDAAGELGGTWTEEEAARFADRMEERVETLAPGFRASIRARHVLTPRDLEARNENLVNGALNGGTAQLHQQLVFRPTPDLGRPETPVAGLYLASSAAHPGGGVHGGPGAIAARAALNAHRTKRIAFAAGAAAIALRRR